MGSMFDMQVETITEGFFGKIYDLQEISVKALDVALFEENESTLQM